MKKRNGRKEKIAINPFTLSEGGFVFYFQYIAESEDSFLVFNANDAI